MKIAIIGAGLSGLVLANRLSSLHTVTVFEKARGPGGRMSTRRADPYAFDHGAQYFTTETERFQDFLAPYIARCEIAEWPDRIELVDGARLSTKQKFAPSPSMNALCKHLATGLDVRTQAHIEQLERSKDGWRLIDKQSEVQGPYDWVVSTAPSVQTEALFPDAFSGHAALQSTKMVGCFALMLGFQKPLDLTWTALKSGTPPIGWIAVNSDKPDRPAPFAMLVQSDNAWAETHLEDDPAEILSVLIEAASRYADTDLSIATHQVLHRWRYAATETLADNPFLLDATLNLAACGDWCLGGKVESAFLSASQLADHFVSTLST